MADREECVYMAKLAEQAERYDEMVRLFDVSGTLSRWTSTISTTILHPYVWLVFIITEHR